MTFSVLYFSKKSVKINLLAKTNKYNIRAIDMINTLINLIARAIFACGNAHGHKICLVPCQPADKCS